jgi:hypothetical protein
MAEAIPILIDAVASAAERPIFVAAVAQLRDCLGQSGIDATWEIEVRPRLSLTAVQRRPAPTAIIVSLLSETARLDEPVADTEARWRAELAALDPDAVPVTFLCTIFRAVRNARADRSEPMALSVLERIRRLNLMIINLSHDLGVNVIDLDRVLAHVGAVELGSGYRMSGALAEEVAAYAVVSALVTNALDTLVPYAALERAKLTHGTLRDLPNLVRRRLQERGEPDVAR